MYSLANDPGAHVGHSPRTRMNKHSHVVQYKCISPPSVHERLPFPCASPGLYRRRSNSKDGTELGRKEIKIRRNREAESDLMRCVFLEGHQSHPEASTLMTWSPPEAPAPRTITLGIRDSADELGVGDTVRKSCHFLFTHSMEIGPPSKTVWSQPLSLQDCGK